MLAVSRLYSFLDHKNGFNIQFLEGQKLIYDLALLHPLQGSGFAYFRDTILGLLPIVFFLKPGESLGLYIDSDEPYFRLKVETNSAGHTRTLLLPAEFNSFPMKISGKARVTKMFPGERSPYTSVIELTEVENKEVINNILKESYQTNSEVIVGDVSDQSIMVTKLPQLNVNLAVDDSTPRKEYIRKNKSFFHDVFEAATDDIEKIVKMFEDRGLSYLGSRQIDFYCPCSKDRMVVNIRSLYSNEIDELFEDQDSLEVSCDYCNKKYEVLKSDVRGS
jgi:molecular chaperone Hsp33